jgi:hypothetical protein
VLSNAIGWTLDPDHEKNWIKHPHKPIKGITPLEHYRK